MTTQPISTDFAGKNIVVTGGSSGVGRAIAVHVAAAGARTVIINYASDRAGADHSAELVRAKGAEAIVVQGDVSQDSDCRRVADAASGLECVDVLFNNAGATVFADQRDLDAVGSEDFLKLYAINVVGPYQMVRALRPALARSASAAVVNIASVSALTGLASSTPYAASKGALLTLTRSLARALAPDIRVNALCPGFIDTPWAVKGKDAQTAAQAAERARSASPLARVASADDIAQFAAFLASPASRHMTGEFLRADGGGHLGAA